jgi:hypothetical protein
MNNQIQSVTKINMKKFITKVETCMHGAWQ